MLDTIHRRRRFDDDLVPGSTWVSFNALYRTDEQSLRVNPIQTGSHNRFADFHILARRDASQLAAIVVDPANFSHRARGLKHGPYAGVLVGYYLHHCEIRPYGDDSADDPAGCGHGHVTLDTVQRPEIDSQAAKPQ